MNRTGWHLKCGAAFDRRPVHQAALRQRVVDDRLVLRRAVVPHDEVAHLPLVARKKIMPLSLKRRSMAAKVRASMARARTTPMTSAPRGLPVSRTVIGRCSMASIACSLLACVSCSFFDLY